MSATRRIPLPRLRLAAAVVSVLGTTAPLLAADPQLVLGVSGGVDIVASAEYSSQPASPAGEFFARLFLGRNLALEASVGLRHSTWSDPRGEATAAWDLRQVPVTAGATWVFAAGQDFRLRAGAGVAVSPTRSTFSSAIYPFPRTVVETSETVVGPYAGVGAQLPLVDKLTLEVLARFVFNPVSPGSGRPTTQNYFWGTFGLSIPF